MKLSTKLVLASQSPRRISLLRQIGFEPIVVPSNIPEVFDQGFTPVENAKHLALKKAKEVSQTFQDAIIIGADTIVILDGDLLGKPENENDARNMLRRLSDRTHTVVTGFALLDCSSGKHVMDFASTDVTFRYLPDEEINTYVAGGSPMDKAGAYGIQDDYGAVFVTRIEGCFYNVMGFPLAKFYSRFHEFQSLLKNQGGPEYVKEN